MIRASVEDHQGRMSTVPGRVEMACVYATLLLLSPILVPVVLAHAAYERITRARDRRAHGHCGKCGHTHDGPLLREQDAHGWVAPRLCKGER